MARIGVAAVRDWRANMLEAVEAGEWAAKAINHARIALLGCFRMAVKDGLMAHNPVLMSTSVCRHQTPTHREIRVRRHHRQVSDSVEGRRPFLGLLHAMHA
jgi:hypothetical protein